MATEVEAAWAAGFFDGEGHVGFYKNGKSETYYRTEVMIGQSGSPELLDRFKEIVGVGQVYGPYAPKKETHKPSYRYHAFLVGDAKIVFDIIGPYLGSVKRTDFERSLNG